MYICAKCDKVSEPNKNLNLVVTETRDVIYPIRENANQPGNRRDGEPRNTSDSGGVGHETVKEMGICDECYMRHMQD